MIVSIDPESTLPPYEQLRVQIAGLIGGGSLPPGARLPAVRQLAADLRVAPGTVARAYRELEDDGWIEGRGRHGTVVRPKRPTKPLEQRRRRLRAETEILVSTARSLGASDAEVLEALRAALGR
jgi:GntR family transcriptional regulator